MSQRRLHGQTDTSFFYSSTCWSSKVGTRPQTVNLQEADWPRHTNTGDAKGDQETKKRSLHYPNTTTILISTVRVEQISEQSPPDKFCTPLEPNHGDLLKNSAHVYGPNSGAAVIRTLLSATAIDRMKAKTTVERRSSVGRTGYAQKSSLVRKLPWNCLVAERLFEGVLYSPYTE